MLDRKSFPEEKVREKIYTENEELEKLREENVKLENLLNIYNNYLSEYQRKYGNELMIEMERRIHTGDFVKNIDVESKKLLLSNFTVLKEIEMQNIEKQGKIDFYARELNKLQVENEGLLLEKDQLLRELEQAKDEQMELYNNALSGKDIRVPEKQLGNSTGMKGALGKTTKYQLEEEFQQAIDEMNSKNENLLEVIRNLEVKLN